MNGLYHNISPCHFSDRIHVSLITYSQIYFWSGDGLPGPPFCGESDLDSYTVMLCSPLGRFPHHCVCLRRQWIGGEWLKEEGPRCSFETLKQQHLVWLVQSCSRDQAGNQNVRHIFLTKEKTTMFANFPASVCFAEHHYVSIECKIYMDSSGSSGNGEYCAYNETTAPISADCFICHHRYKQRPVSKPVKTHSFETGIPV